MHSRCMVGMDLARWLDLMRRLDLPRTEDTWQQLVDAHGEPARHYHEVGHIEHCLALVDRHRTQIPDADWVELAFWFHDAIYDTHSQTNEQDSADWALGFLQDQGAAQEVAQSVYDLIIATDHSREVAAAAAAWMIDIDLSILGAEPEVYDRYCAAIRREYHWVPEADYRTGRAAVLQTFLGRETIYRTAEFRDRYEARARANLTRESTVLETRLS